MQRETRRISEVMPDDATLFDGEFEMEGEVAVRSRDLGAAGDLRRVEFELVSDGGRAAYTMLGRGHYYADWGTYDFRKGLTYSARVEQPVIELHFQLGGSAHAVQASRGLDLQLQAGQTNLVVFPPAGGTFELKEASRGEVFEVMLSMRYFEEVAARHPHLLEGLRERVHRDEVALFGREHLRMTPQMWGVIQRIRRHSGDHCAGSLFLEAQILELLGLQMAQLREPAPRRELRLSRADVDGIHAARELLLARLADPPTLAELARCALTNEFKLKRGFKALFGTSPYAYLLQHRLELARAYLLDTDWTVAEIARRVGYSDPAHLTHVFRKRFGIRPSDLR